MAVILGVGITIGKFIIVSVTFIIYNSSSANIL